jgi:ABC-2 type transport system permease protein
MQARRIIAVAKKEMLLRMRYRGAFLVSTFFEPLKMGLLFFFIYTGFYSSGASSIGGVTHSNYVVFLLLGILSGAYFRMGTDLLAFSFYNEKIFQTIKGLLISPAQKIEIILGIGIRGLVENIPMTVIIFAILFAVAPIGPAVFLYVLSMFALLYLLVLGFGFVSGAFALANESVSKIFDVGAWAWIMLSCFYYPIESTPRLIRPIIELNPAYQVNVAIKAAWMSGQMSAGSLAYALVAAIVSLYIGVIVFNAVWNRMGLEGY